MKYDKEKFLRLYAYDGDERISVHFRHSNKVVNGYYKDNGLTIEIDDEITYETHSIFMDRVELKELHKLLGEILCIDKMNGFINTLSEE